jgi:hypothetical protein
MFDLRVLPGRLAPAWLLALAACSSGGSDGGRSSGELCTDARVAATSLAAVPGPQALAVVGATLFVMYDDQQGTSSGLSRLPRAGGTLEHVDEIVYAGSPLRYSLVSDGTHAFYALFDHGMQVKEHGAPETTFSFPGEHDLAMGVAADEHRSYAASYNAYNEPAAFGSVAAGAFTPLGTAPSSDLVGGLASDGASLYLVMDDTRVAGVAGPPTLQRIPVSGGTLEVVAEHVDDWIAADAEGIYYTARAAETDPSQLWHVAPGGKPASLLTFATGESPHGLALGADAIYALVSDGSNFEVQRIPREGGCHGVVGKSAETPTFRSWQPITVDGANVYWVTADAVMSAAN